MRLSLIFAAALLAAPLAAPAAAQELGQRTQSPDQMLRQMTPATGDEDLARSIAAADAYPLGSLDNPVRVGGPEGARAYLARLRCGDGQAPRIGDRADGGVGAFGTVVSAYPLDCGAAAPGRATVNFDLYHAEHREDRAPTGFALTR